MKREILDGETQIFLDSYIVFDPARKEFQLYTKIDNKIKPFTMTPELFQIIIDQLKELN
jgi:hypothetical protein